MNGPLMPAARRWRLGIGGRLTAGYVAIVGLAVGACLVGWLTFREIAGDISQFAENQVPQLALSARLSRAGSEIGAAAPALAGAESRSSYTAERRRYAAALANLEKLGTEIARTKESAFSPALSGRVRETLAAIDIAAGKRFTLIEEMHADLQQLRWAQADLITETAPLTDDIRFNVETAIRQERSAVALAEQQRSEALLSMVAQANLSIGVLSNVVGATNLQELQEANAFLGDSVDELTRHIAALEDWPDAITVQQLARSVLAHANPQTGVPNRKRTELREAARLEELAATNHALVVDLGRSIEREVGAIEARAGAAADRTRQAMRIGNVLMVIIAAVAATMAIAIGYLYVDRSLLARIRRLAIDAGHLSREGPARIAGPRGADELDDLARALALFRRTQDELVQSAKLAALGQMAAGIGHEMNQPLAAMRAHLHSADALIRRCEQDRALANIGKMHGLTERMSGQIAHIRRFARKPVTTLARVDLIGAVREALALVEHRFEEEGVLLDLALPQDTEILVEAEMVRLEQVIVNLLTNALDAVSGLVERRVSIEVAVRRGQTVLSVRDTGAGVEAEDKALVFDPFYTTKPPGSGLGLGLSISFNIMRDFGGTLQIAETGPRGTEMQAILKSAA